MTQLGRLAPIALVVLCMATAVWLYPFDSDAAFAVHDPIWYGVGAERFPALSINPHHPLFHVLVVALTPILRALDVTAPGHIATRLVAGIGGAWILLQIGALAGRRRVLVGTAFALLLFSTRGFIVEMATGENVLPAVAAALCALTLAARPAPNLLATGTALTAALLLRQDNVFVAPAVALGVAVALPKGARLAGVVKLTLFVSLATAAAFFGAWLIARGPTETLTDWMLRFGLHGPWTGPKDFQWSRLLVHVASIATAMTGRLTPPEDDRAIFGIFYLLAILVPGALLRGSSPNLRLGALLLIALVPRTLFYTWYEADNFEWLVFAIVGITAFSASLAHGEPATGRPLRVAGVVLLLLLAASVLVSHARYSWRLRERNLMSAIEEASNVDRAKWRFLAYGARVGAGLTMLGIPLDQGDGPDVGVYYDVAPKGAGSEDLFERINQQRAAHRVPTVIIADRFVMDGMPYTSWSRGEWAIDSSELPGWELMRRGGRAFAGRWVPHAIESKPHVRPESR